MLLINPPVTKPCEPPAGVARLAGALASHGIPCKTWDASLEALLWLMEQPSTAIDTWSRRATRHRDAHLASLRDPGTYASPDRYTRAVQDLNRLVAVQGKQFGAAITLGDFQQQGFSPIRSTDLLAAAETPERNAFFPFFRQRLHELLADGTDMVGFSLCYLNQAVCTFSMIGHLRRHYPQIRIILGGGLVTSWCQRPDWRNPFAGLVDDLVAGPGEPFLLSQNGIATEMQTHPLPDYSGLPIEQYLSPGFILPYSSASGCYWRRCAFCPETAERNRYEPLPAGRVIAQLQELVEEHHPALVHLLDNAISPALLKALADEPVGAPWYGFVRFTPELADLDFCRALAASGCVMLKLGLESGDQGVLDKLEKGIDLQLAATILDNLRRAGIASYVYLLFGTPAEDEAAARRTLQFVRQHHEAISFLNLALFNMPLESADAACLSTGQEASDNLSLYTPFHHPTGWDRHRVRRFINGEFSRDPHVAAILRRDPPLFTSNHAAFFAH